MKLNTNKWRDKTVQLLARDALKKLTTSNKCTDTPHIWTCVFYVLSVNVNALHKSYTKCHSLPISTSEESPVRKLSGVVGAFLPNEFYYCDIKYVCIDVHVGVELSWISRCILSYNQSSRAWRRDKASSFMLDSNDDIFAFLWQIN